MLGLEKKLIEERQPDWIHDGKVPTDVKLDFDLLTDILPTKAHVLIYEEISGIKVPDKYMKKYDK